MEHILQELQNELDGWRNLYDAEKEYYKGHEQDREAIKSFAECEQRIKEYSQAIKILKEHGSNTMLAVTERSEVAVCDHEWKSEFTGITNYERCMKCGKLAN